MIIIQFIGFLALLGIVSSYQMKKRRSMLSLQIIGSGLFVVHFWLLGGITGAVLNIVSVIRAIMFERYGKKLRPIWPFIFIIGLFILTGIFTWQGPASILPTIAMIAATVGFWMRDTQSARKFILISPPLWFTYSLITGSIPGMLTEVFNLSSVVVGLWRHRRTSKPRPNKVKIKP